jgi:large subunit ribosomal protein L23
MMKPLFTEKSLMEAQIGRFTFKVERSLNKFQIKALIQELFKVNVTSVSTINYKGGVRRTNRGSHVTTTPWKKAIVTLKSGQVIDLFSQDKKEKPAKKAKSTK